MHQVKELGKENITRLLLRFSVPAIVGMLVNALYNVVDRIFVGNGVGSLGIAGITVTFPVMLITMACAMLVGIGSGSLISIRLGEKREEEAEVILGNALVLLLVISGVLTAAGLVFAKPLLLAIGASETVLPYALSYARIVLAGTVFTLLGMGLNNIIRAEGNPKIAMLTMIIGAVTNIILDALFILVLGWGIQGAALATVIAKAVSASWVLYHFIWGRSVLKLRRVNFRPNQVIVLKVLALGAAPFAMQLAASLLNVVLNKSLDHYGGDLAITAMGVVTSIATLILMPIFGISQGLQPIIGYNYGAKNYHRVREALLKGMVAASAMAFCGFLAIQIFPRQLVALFNREDLALIAFGAQAMRTYLVMLPIIGFQAVGAQYFQAVGRPRQAAFLSLSRQVLILIPSVLILPLFFGVRGIMYAGPLSDVLAALLTATWIGGELARLKQQGQGQLAN